MNSSNNEQTKKHTRWYGIPLIAGYLKVYRRRMIFMIALVALSSALDSLYPLFNKYVINHNVGEMTLDTLPIVTVLYLAILLFHSFENYFTCLLCSKL